MVEALLEHASWLTPTSLFLLLNLVIATIVFSHRRTNHHDPTSDSAPPPHLARAPSLFSRVTSFNLSNYHPHPHHDLSGRADGSSPDEATIPEPELKTEVKRAVTRAPSLLSRVASFTVGGRGFAEEEVCDTKVEEKVKKGKGKKKKKEKMEKVERVDTVSFKRNEEEVDAKADDFINRFKQQLKLQRIESLMRYRSA